MNLVKILEIQILMMYRYETVFLFVIMHGQRLSQDCWVQR